MFKKSYNLLLAGTNLFLQLSLCIEMLLSSDQFFKLSNYFWLANARPHAGVQYDHNCHRDMDEFGYELEY